jgi:hypothetical protein
MDPVATGPAKDGEDSDREARGQSPTETVLGQSDADPYAKDHRELRDNIDHSRSHRLRAGGDSC